MEGDRPSDLQRYANKATIHGIADFVSSKSTILKIIWGLFLLAAAAFLCEEVYRQVNNYQSEPTSFEVTYISMDTFPTIHICVENWFDGSTALMLGFQDKDIAYLCSYFLLKSDECSNYQYLLDGNLAEIEIALKDKMEKHNLTTLGDMLNLITPDMFSTSPTMKWTVWSDAKQPGRVCYSVSNVTCEDTYYYLAILKAITGVLVVGEDPFGPHKYEFDKTETSYDVDIWDVNKLVLLNKRRDYCNNDYESREVCVMDCLAEKEKCICNITTKVSFPYNDEDFWQVYSPEWQLKFSHNCVEVIDNSSRNTCDQRFAICKQKCSPCTVWGYQYRARRSPSFINRTSYTMVNFNVEKKIKISKEYYTYAAPSLVSDVGGLMGLFCGASILSIVQVMVYCCDHGTRSLKMKAFH